MANWEEMEVKGEGDWVGGAHKFSLGTFKPGRKRTRSLVSPSRSHAGSSSRRTSDAPKRGHGHSPNFPSSSQTSRQEPYPSPTHHTHNHASTSTQYGSAPTSPQNSDEHSPPMDMLNLTPPSNELGFSSPSAPYPNLSNDLYQPAHPMIIIPSRYYFYFNGTYYENLLDANTNVAMVDCACGVRVRVTVETSHNMTSMKVSPAAGAGLAKNVQFFIPSILRLTFGPDEQFTHTQARSTDGASCISSCLNCQAQIFINWDFFTSGFVPHDPGLM